MLRDVMAGCETSAFLSQIRSVNLLQIAV